MTIGSLSSARNSMISEWVCCRLFFLRPVYQGLVSWIAIGCFLGVLSAIVLSKISRWDQYVHSFSERNFVLSLITRKLCFCSIWSAAAGAILGLNVVVFAELCADKELGMAWIVATALAGGFLGMLVVGMSKKSPRLEIMAETLLCVVFSGGLGAMIGWKVIARIRDEAAGFRPWDEVRMGIVVITITCTIVGAFFGGAFWLKLRKVEAKSSST